MANTNSEAGQFIYQVILTTIIFLQIKALGLYKEMGYLFVCKQDLPDVLFSLQIYFEGFYCLLETFFFIWVSCKNHFRFSSLMRSCCRVYMYLLLNLLNSQITVFTVQVEC